MSLKLFLTGALFLPLLLLSQNQTSKWMFGQYSGLDFMTVPPSVITGSMYTSEGCSSIADNSGNLLFYTNGVSIWDQTNAVMANGSGLLGNMSSTQSSLIVKQPGNANIYYVFTLDDVGGTDGLRYSIVDMNLAVGMGSVTTKNTFLYAPSTEKLAAVKHCNKTDIWIVSHEWGNNRFRSYLLNANGLVQPAVTSSVGTIHTGGNVQYAKIGSMKISPTGKKLGICLRGGLDAVEIYDFDDATGTVSNPVVISNIADTYGCEFSPDGARFYVSTAEPATGTAGYLYQWNLCAGLPAAIASSSIIIDYNNYDIYRALQLGPDGKIYVAHSGYDPIGVINNPNGLGAACNYANSGQPVGLCQLGLPGFVATYFRQPPPSFTFSMSCQTVSFSAGPYPTCNAMGFDYTGASWNFGDTSPSGSGFSTSHFYSPGTYTVLCVLNRSCSSDTLTQIITVPSQLPVFSVTGQSVICKGASTTLSVNNTANTYTWMPGQIFNTLASVNPTTTTVYTITATHTLTGCKANKTLTLVVNPCTGLTENNMLNAGITIYPNPAVKEIQISGLNKSLTRDLQVDVTDISGRKIKSVTHKKGEDKPIDIYEMENGIYILSVIDDNGLLIYTGKFVKQE